MYCTTSILVVKIRTAIFWKRFPFLTQPVHPDCCQSHSRWQFDGSTLGALWREMPVTGAVTGNQQPSECNCVPCPLLLLRSALINSENFGASPMAFKEMPQQLLQEAPRCEGWIQRQEPRSYFLLQHLCCALHVTSSPPLIPSAVLQLPFDPHLSIPVGRS